MPISQPWSQTRQRVLDELEVRQERGLRQAEVGERRQRLGSNELRRTERRSLWSMLFEQLKSFVVGLLVVGALLSFVFGQAAEGLAILAVIVLNTLIFGNIRKFVVYLISCNLSEILTVGLASLSNAPLPILPLQILFLNLVTDVFPALALGAGEGEPEVMRQPPRDPSEPLLTRAHWLRIALYSILLATPVLVGLGVARWVLQMPVEQSVTVSFLILALGQVVHVFNMRTRNKAYCATR